MSDSWKLPNPGLKLTALQLDGTLGKSPVSIKVHKRVLEKELKTSMWALAEMALGRKNKRLRFPIFGNKKTGVNIPFLFQNFQQQKIVP